VIRALALVALLGCDWSLHRMQEQPRCQVHQQTDLLPGGQCDQQPPPGVVAYGPAEPPPPVTRALLERGRDRFARFCAPCHGVAADGDSYVAQVMELRKPPSLVDQAASRLSDERIMTVMATGYGLMPSYAEPLALRDRYAILHFVRAMQGRVVAWSALEPAQRAEAMTWLP